MRLIGAIFFASVSISLGSCSLPKKYYVENARYANEYNALRHNFVAIEDGAIYSSANPSPEFIKWLIEVKGVRTFISLRGEPSANQSRVIQQHGVEIRVFSWSAHRVPPEHEINEVLSLMSNSRDRPVHVFCRGGADRTGFIRAYWRISKQNWNRDQAMTEFRMHFHLFRNDLDEYLERRFPDS
jgi:protein tyrosine/serine phosphatase